MVCAAFLELKTMPPLRESTRLLINLKTNAVKMSPADCERFMRVVELLEFWEKREERKKEEERRLLLQELLQEEKEKEAERQLLQELIQEEKEKEQQKNSCFASTRAARLSTATTIAHRPHTLCRVTMTTRRKHRCPLRR